MKHECNNCGAVYAADEELAAVFPNIPDLWERLDPGGTVPSGECPQCGALVYPQAEPPALVCKVCGDNVQEDDLREHLSAHNPNARGLDLEDIREQFTAQRGPRRHVVVTVSGGVAEVEHCPKGVSVSIRDYDTEGCDPDELEKDGSMVSEWDGGDE